MGKGVKLKKRKSRKRQTFHSVTPQLQVQSIRQISGRTARVLALAMAGAIAVLALVYWLFTAPQFYVHGAYIRGIQRLDKASVYWASDVEGKQILKVNPGKTAQRIESALPYVKKARVHRGLPNNITIDITERTPEIVWNNPSGTTWVDAEGVSLEPMGAPPAIYLSDPTGKAANSDGKMIPAYLEAMLRLHKELGVTDFKTGSRGLEMKDPAGWTVAFGEYGGLSRRIGNYLKARQGWLKKGIRPHDVDARFKRIYRR